MPTLTSAPSASDTTARPKIMRRPAQFSSPTPILIVQEPALNTPVDQPHESLTITVKAWQDDGRFALALVLLLMAFNLLVSVWLAPVASHVQPVATTTPSVAPAVTILNELNPSESSQ